MKIIIKQNYINKKTNEIYSVDSIGEDDIIIKSLDGLDVIKIKQKEFTSSFTEIFNKKVFVAKQGHLYIKVNYEEIINKLHGLGICDKCNDLAIFNPFTDTANLIPVLNMVFCNKCFAKWENNSKFHKEDRKYENKKIKRYLDLLEK